jgi:hypothetical protein
VGTIFLVLALIICGVIVGQVLAGQLGGLRGTVDLAVMIATVTIAYFARSTDAAYHRIAEVADRLATIAKQQQEILAARDEPVISAKVESILDQVGPANKDRLVITNTGSPITEIKVETAEIFEVTFWQPDPPGHVEVKRIGSIGYSPGHYPPSPGVGIIFHSVPSPYPDTLFEIHKTLDREFNGYRARVDFKRYFSIEYLNRIGETKTRWFRVDAFGSAQIPEREAREVFLMVKQSITSNTDFVFYSMDIEQFWELVGRIAPPPPQIGRSRRRNWITRWFS